MHLGSKTLKLDEVAQFLWIQYKMMQKVNKFFAQFDAFSTTPTLRAKGQSQLSSLFTGIFSFLMIIGFTYLFIVKLIQVFNYQQISSNQTEEKLLSNQTQHPDLFFGIRIMYLQVNGSRKLFNLSYQLVDNGTLVKKELLVPCTANQWAKLGQNYQQQFQESQLFMFFCLPQPVTISKSFFRTDSAYVKVLVQRCDVSIAGCASNAQFQQFMQYKSVAIVNMYFLDATIRSADKNPMVYTVNTDPQFSFTLTRSILANVQIGSFTVTTDYGVWPWEEVQQVKGNFAYSFRDTSFTASNSVSTFAMVFIYMNRYHMSVDRTVGKVDEMLSYAGGFFSLVVSFFAFFLASYNEYRYQLMIGQGIFHEDQDGKTIRQSHLGIFTYIKYTIFDWVNSLCCCTVKWQDCVKIDDARQQANSQIDVTNFFRKIQVIQSLFSNLMNRQVKNCIALVKPDNLSQVQQSRLILQYYDCIVQGREKEVSITIQQYCIIKAVERFGQQGKNVGQQYKKFNSQDLSDTTRALSLFEQNFPQTMQFADEIFLQEQLQEIQNVLVEQYFAMNPGVKAKIQYRIPVIILIRLYRKKKQQQQNIGQDINFEQLSQSFNRNQVQKVSNRVYQSPSVRGVETLHRINR